MVASSTANYSFPKPDTDKNIDEEFYRFRDETLDLIDGAIKSVQTMAEGKAATNHGHQMSQIQGLIDALNGKMPANRSFTLDDLGDVDGAAIAPVNYVLVKSADGKWVASSALAALGQHGHTMAEITGLIAALNAKADGSAVNNVLVSLDQAVASRLRYLPTGAALPTSNIGPLWHDDYASVMTWQTFNANGANYAGYASIEVGRPILDGQSSPRPGWVKRNGASLSKTTYAALWNWALHNGLVVTLGSWTSGPLRFADNGNGTFRLPDNRGEFERAWDDGRGVDSGRVIGSFQDSQNLAHAHTVTMLRGRKSGQDTPTVWSWNENQDGAASVTSSTSGGSEARPRNLALLAAIKF